MIIVNRIKNIFLTQNTSAKERAYEHDVKVVRKGQKIHFMKYKYGSLMQEGKN